MHGDVVLQQPLNIAMLGKDERLLLGARMASRRPSSQSIFGALRR